MDKNHVAGGDVNIFLSTYIGLGLFHGHSFSRNEVMAKVVM